MKAAVLVADRKIEFMDVPEPEPPGEGRVIIRVNRASICGTDLHIYLGEFKDRVTYSRILCHEFSGTIEETCGTGSRFARSGRQGRGGPDHLVRHVPHLPVRVATTTSVRT